MRHCQLCNAPIVGRRKDAIYCSEKCTKRAWTAKQPEVNASDTPSEERQCNVCKAPKPLGEFTSKRGCKGGKTGTCKLCAAARSNRWYRANRDRARSKTRDTRLVRDFGISTEQYEQKLEDQGGKCAICGEPPGQRRLAVDHDHTTGEVRGLLCGNCNMGIGMFSENLELFHRAAEYVARWKACA